MQFGTAGEGGVQREGHAVRVLGYSQNENNVLSVLYDIAPNLSIESILTLFVLSSQLKKRDLGNLSDLTWRPRA